jgi:hypothetical protein
MSVDEYIKTAFLSLAPMEAKDLNTALANFESLCSSTDKDALMAAHDSRSCSHPGDKGSSQMEYVRARLLEKREKLYDHKGRTHRMSITEGTREDDGKQTLHIQTYAEHLDTANVRTGYWAASWDVVILTERECELSGAIQIHSCYAEKTNVHMLATRDYESRVISVAEEKVNSMVAVFEKDDMSYEEQLAKVIADTIWEYEQALYSDLQRMCDEVDDSLKRIRRVSARAA